MNNDENLQPKHPGTHLREQLAELGLAQTDLAFILGQTPRNINEIIAERRGVGAEMSKALGVALGQKHDHYANLQTMYDLAHAATPDPQIAERAEMLRQYPLREMLKRGWVHEGEDLKAQLARFSDGLNPSELPFAAKQTNYGEKPLSAQIALTAWVLRVRQLAKSVFVPPYSRSALAEAVEQMRQMLLAPEEARNIPRLLAECGVRFVIIESMPQAKIDGVCFWLGDSPVIGMSTRFDRIDNFWFVLRHEIEHVLREDGKAAWIIDSDLEGSQADNSLPKEEQIANKAAADFCVPTSKLESFILRKKPFFYERDVLAFAKINNVHPGLVVGQIQRALNRYDYLRKYQVKIRQYVLPGAIADGWDQSMLI